MATEPITLMYVAVKPVMKIGHSCPVKSVSMHNYRLQDSYWTDHTDVRSSDACYEERPLVSSEECLYAQLQTSG
jgi:hypothetical protein